MSKLSPATVEMVRCFRDRREALSLIHSAYVRAGLPSQSTNALRVTKHQLLPRSRIFVAKAEGKVTSTLSLIPDSPAGLALDEVCPESLARLRGQGQCIAEVGCFADRRQERGRFAANFFSLLRFICQYAVAQGIDCLVMASHPGRARFLEAYLGFNEKLVQCDSSLDPERAVVVLAFDFDRMRTEEPEKYQAYFADKVPLTDFAGGFMPRWEADYFGCPIASGADPLIALPFGPSRVPALGVGSHMPTS